MTGTFIYFDHNSSAPLRDCSRSSMESALSHYGNASSVHSHGRRQRSLVEAARQHVADLVGASLSGVIFTSGATESAHLALSGELAGPVRCIYALSSEHICILSGGGNSVTEIPVLPSGLIDKSSFLDILESHDASNGVFYLAIQLANSESGVIQPVREIADLVHAHGGYVLCDAVQAVGRMPVDITELGVDCLLLSAHKIGGPQGSGALVLARGDQVISSVLSGGGQENGRRAGTENVAAIAGFGAAAIAARQEAENYDGVSKLRNELESNITSIASTRGLGNSLHIFGEGVPRLGNTLLYAISGISAQTSLISFDLAGIALSSGSACSAGKVGESHVLTSMGISPEIAHCAIRVSLGYDTSESDIKTFCRTYEGILDRITASSVTGTRSSRDTRISA